MKKLTYIDIGLHTHAREIVMMQEACARLDVELTVHGIEANPQYITPLRKRFAHQPNIYIHCYAIGAPTDAKLYLSPESGGHGNSIYPDKNNVTEDYVPTVGIQLTDLIDNGTIALADINILKYNIEGAELQLMKNLVENQMQGVFAIYAGAGSDLHKVKSLAPLERNYKASLAAMGINPVRFYHSPVPEYTAKMIDEMVTHIKPLL